MRQIVLDTETTGLLIEEGHRMIEIGCIELIDRRASGKRYHTYLNPEREVEEEAIKIHGITNQFLQDKPLFSTIAQEFMDFISGAELIIHNASFDIGFINSELKRTGQSWKPLTDYCSVVDTLILARQLHAGQRNSLDALCKRYSIDNSHREFHGALLDAHLLAQIYLAMTGGQGSLFDQLNSLETTVVENKPHIPLVFSDKARCVLKATSEELFAHETYLSTLREKGKCFWS